MAEEHCNCNLHIKQIFMSEETVTISKKKYESLKEDARWLQCPENAGVDRWEGYDYARELLNEEND
jgi:PHD/YefM family antitoxin component YafN of YafNO toxin-antitoxin module